MSRAIDNYTDKEREVLQLKGMTAPRTASERGNSDDQSEAIKRFRKTYNLEDMTHENTGKPAGIRETQNEQDNREEREQANKAQPQHSPMWAAWLSDYENLKQTLKVEQHDHQKAVHKLLKAKSHADKLAEALRRALPLLEYCETYRRSDAHETAQASRLALAAYEKSL